MFFTKYFYKICSLAVLLYVCFCGGVSLLSAPKSYALTLPGGMPPKYTADFSHVKYANPHAPQGGTIKLKTHQRAETLNPFKGVLAPAPELEITFATLLASPIDDWQNLYGYVAESMDLQNTHVTFHLRKDAIFEDDSPILPEDILFSFEFFSKHAAPSYQTLYQNISHGEKMGPFKVRFYFKKEGHPSLNAANLGKMPILSHKDRDLCQQERLTIPLLSSGPYHLKSFEPGNMIQYHQIKNWWGKNLPLYKGHYNFERIEYHYFSHPIVALEAFKKGEYDLRLETRASFWKKNYDFEAATSGHVLKKTFKKAELHGFNAIFINTRRPYLQDLKVRLALNILLDFEMLNKLLFYGTYKRNTSVFMNTGFGGDHPLTEDEKKLAHKLDIPEFILINSSLSSNTSARSRKQQALNLLNQAGWQIVQGELLHVHTRKPFKLEIITPYPGQARLLEQYVKTLRDVGIDAYIRLLSMPVYLKRLRHFGYDLTLESLPPMITPGYELKNFWGSSSAEVLGNYNFSGIQDPKVDLLIDKILKEKNPKTLRALTSLLDRALFAGMYFIPLWHPDHLFVAFWNKFSYPHLAPKVGFTYHTWWAKEK